MAETVRIQKAALVPVTCAIPANLLDRMEDGNFHEFRAVIPVPVVVDGAAMKDVLRTITQYGEVAQKITDGADVEIMDGDNVLTKVTPTDEIGPEKDRKEKMEDGKPTGKFVVFHGQVFMRNLPVEAKEIVDAIVAGLRTKVSQVGRTMIVQQFGSEAKRGRGVQEVDVAAF